ncbi:MAG: apolipoprotein N-acyltransferase [Candidatus Cloacimonadota bacterium]
MNKFRSLIPILIATLLLSLSRLPLHLGFLSVFAWLPLLWYFDLRYHKLRELFVAALLFCGVFTASVLYWIATVTLPGLIGIWVIHSLFYTLAFYAIQRVWNNLPKFRYPIFVAVLLSLEYLIQFGETRFPWLNISYALSEYNLFLQALDLVGQIGLSALVLILSICLYQALRGRYKALIPAAVIIVLWAGYGLWRISDMELEKHEAGIFIAQPSIPQDKKWDESFYLEILSRYDKLSAEAKADSAKLLILPEGSFPVYLIRDPGQLAPLYQLIQNYGLEYFAGFPDYRPAPSDHVDPNYYYNAAALFSEVGDRPEPYYKNILVPVGERMLWLDLFPFLWKLQFGQANWEFGTELKWYRSGDFEFSPSICYELAFPELYHKSAIPKGPEGYRKTDYLVNITNDAWFGTSYGPWLHGIMTKYRAIENRVQIYRAAQTGISMIIDPMGRTLNQTKLFELSNITAPLYISRSIPPIRRIYRYPMLIVLFAITIFIWACIKKLRKEERS